MQGFEDITRLVLGRECGVYVLYLDQQCVYVGQSTKVFTRLREHMNRMRNSPTFKFNRIMVKWCHEDKLIQLEFVTIQELRPIMNKQGMRDCWPKIKIDLVALGLQVPIVMERRD